MVNTRKLLAFFSPPFFTFLLVLPSAEKKNNFSIAKYTNFEVRTARLTLVSLLLLVLTDIEMEEEKNQHEICSIRFAKKVSL